MVLEKGRGARGREAAARERRWRGGSLFSRRGRKQESREREGRWYSPGDCCAVATSLDVEASRVPRWGGLPPLFLPRWLFLLFLPLPLVSTLLLRSFISRLSRSTVPRCYRHPRLSFTRPPNCLFLALPSNSLAFSLLLAASRVLSFTLDRALSPPSLVHPTLSPTPLLRSLTLSPRSSAKTSIRLSPVAPRYTDPTGPSRRAPRGNVDPVLCISHPSLAVSRRHTRAPCVTCYLRVTQCNPRLAGISHQSGGATQFALSLVVLAKFYIPRRV